MLALLFWRLEIMTLELLISYCEKTRPIEITVFRQLMVVRKRREPMRLVIEGGFKTNRTFEAIYYDVSAFTCISIAGAMDELIIIK